MTEREVTITELHAAGPQGRKLLALAEFARVSYRVAEEGGRQTVTVGGPNRLTVHPRNGETYQPSGTAPDLGEALKKLFADVANSTNLIESSPPPDVRGVKSLFRYRNGKFEV